MSKLDNVTWGSGGLFKNRALGSLILMLTTPIFCLTFVYTCYQHEGSFQYLYEEYQTIGLYDLISRIWPTSTDPIVWKHIIYYMIFQLILMRFVPGKIFYATVTPSGHIPTYIANGIQSYIITICTLLYLYKYEVFNPSLIYDNMGKFLSSMNLFAMIFCGVLTVKGLYFPSTKDHGSNGNIIVDYFWGTELYPRIFGWDVKQFTNCRFGMMFWQVAILSYAIKQYETLGYVSSSMLVSVFIQSVYIAKFFWWETGNIYSFILMKE